VLLCLSLAYLSVLLHPLYVLLWLTWFVSVAASFVCFGVADLVSLFLVANGVLLVSAEVAQIVTHDNFHCFIGKVSRCVCVSLCLCVSVCLCVSLCVRLCTSSCSHLLRQDIDKYLVQIDFLCGYAAKSKSSVQVPIPLSGRCACLLLCLADVCVCVCVCVCICVGGFLISVFCFFCSPGTSLSFWLRDARTCR
jgi:hypothetical protein